MPGGSRSQWPVVIGGCHRSGTSLIRRIVDSHSHIRCGPEVKLFPDLFGDAPDDLRYLRFMHTVRSLASEDELVEVLGGALIELHERASRAAGKPRWADKAPENVLYWRQWQRLLGDRWWLVHVVRNPLDTIASLIEARFPDVPSALLPCVDYYCGYLLAGSRFAAEHPARYRVVVYEQLVQQPEATLGALMASLDERLEPAQLRFDNQPQVWSLEDRKVLETSEVHDRSLHRWRSRLTLPDAELIWDLTAEAWSRLDPDQRFVDPPAEPRGSTGWPA